MSQQAPQVIWYSVWEAALRAVALCDANTPELPGASENIWDYSHSTPGFEGEAVGIMPRL